MSLPFCVMVTPDGMAMGARPIRDIVFLQLQAPHQRLRHR
jgi:hypothetical protein